MTTFESDIKKLEAPAEKAFRVLSDLRNIETHLQQMPDEQVELKEITEDSVFFKVQHAGELGLRIIDKEPSKTIKFESINSPIVFNLWIQLKEVAENDTRVKLTLKSDMNPMVKMMVAKPIKQFMAKLTDAIAMYNYN